MDGTTPYTIVISTEEPTATTTANDSKPLGAVVQDAWESTITNVQSAWDAVTHHSTVHVENTQRAVQPALEQAGESIRSVSEAVGQTAAGLSQATGDNARALSVATTVAALTTLQATKQSLANIGSNPLTVDEATGETVVKGEKTDGLVMNVAASPVTAVSAVGLVSGIMSFFMIASRLVDIASLTLILFAPYVAYQKWQLAGLGGMRGQQNRLRKSANELTVQNGKLTQSVDEFEQQVQRYVSIYLYVCIL
jgi:hypothetical protein